MQKTEELIAPIPRDHFAKMVGGSWAWIRKLIDNGKLPALELIQDEETLESVLIPYTSGKAKQHSLFIDHHVATFYMESLSKVARGPNELARGPRGKYPSQEEWETAFEEGRFAPYEPCQDVPLYPASKKYYPYRASRALYKELKDTQVQSTVLAPVSMTHLARRAGCTVSMLFHAARGKELNLVEFVFDEESMTSTLRPYALRSTPHQGKSVYVMPDEARRYVADVQRKREEAQKDITTRDFTPNQFMYQRASRRAASLYRDDGTLIPEEEREIIEVAEAQVMSKEFEEKVLGIARDLKAGSTDGKVERGKILEIISGKRNNTGLYKKIKFIMDQHIDEFPPHRSGPHAFLSKKN